jgi:hypothetical protein
MPELFQFAEVVPSLFANAAPSSTLQKLLYDRKSAAYVLSISVRALDYLIAHRKLDTIRLGKKVMIGHGTLVKFSRANHLNLTEHPSEALVM